MPKINYSRTSPYAATAQTSWYLGNYKHRQITRDSGDQPIVLDKRHEYRPDKLSQELYGTPALWWVFMARNLKVIRDPLNDFTAGKLIYAPSLAHLRDVLGL